MSTEQQQINELKFEVQGLKQAIQELQTEMNKLLGHETPHPATKADTPRRPRVGTRF